MHRNWKSSALIFRIKYSVSTETLDSSKSKITNGEEWKVVNHRPTGKRRKALVVGSSPDSTSVEGLDKCKASHVSNLRPDTTEENLHNFLKQNFSIVICEKLVSRYPEHYSSFNLSISSSDYEEALDSANCPNKVNVHHLFHRSKIQIPQINWCLL